jgi:hypothetical protein
LTNRSSRAPDALLQQSAAAHKDDCCISAFINDKRGGRAQNNLFVMAITFFGERRGEGTVPAQEGSVMKIIAGCIIAIAMIAGTGTAIALSVKQQRTFSEDHCIGLSCWPDQPDFRGRCVGCRR